MWHASRFLYNSTRTTVIEERWRMDGGENEKEGGSDAVRGKEDGKQRGSDAGRRKTGLPHE